MNFGYLWRTVIHKYRKKIPVPHHTIKNRPVSLCHKNETKNILRFVFKDSENIGNELWEVDPMKVDLSPWGRLFD